jgi:hypothetical protein
VEDGGIAGGSTTTSEGRHSDGHKEASAQDVLRRVHEENVEFVRFWFTDIFGQLKSFAIGRDELRGALDDRRGLRRRLDHGVQPD